MTFKEALQFKPTPAMQARAQLTLDRAAQRLADARLDNEGGSLVAPGEHLIHEGVEIALRVQGDARQQHDRQQTRRGDTTEHAARMLCHQRHHSLPSSDERRAAMVPGNGLAFAGLSPASRDRIH